MPNKRAADKRRLDVYLRDVEFDRLDRAAAEAGLNRTDFVKRALRQLMDSQGEKGGAAA